MRNDKKSSIYDRYVCEHCGFELLVTESCTRKYGDPLLNLCDKQMNHVESQA